MDPENTRPLDDKMQLESLLTGRLRTLDSEVSELRREVKLANQREIVSKNSIQSLRQSLEVSSTLIARLEADLELQTVINQQNMATISRTENSTDFSFITASPSTTNISYPSMYNRTKKGPRLSNTVPSTTVSGNSTVKPSRRHSFSLVENDVDLEKPDWDSTNESTTSIASPTGTTNIQSTTELGQEDGNIQSTESIEMPIVSPTMKQHKSINATTTSNTTSNVSAGNEMIASGHINTSTNNNNTAASNSMVSIIQGQRDRYKQKLTQVEGSLVDTQKQLKVISEAKQQLETDNIALYSKIRYLQSYQQSNSIDRDGNSNQVCFYTLVVYIYII